VANKRVGKSAAEMTARELAMRLVTRVSTVQSAEQVPAAGGEELARCLGVVLID